MGFAVGCVDMSTIDQDRSESLARFRDLLGKFDDAMLVSRDQHGRPHARPMRIVDRDRERPDDLWFVTSLDSGKVREIREEPRVAVTMADGKRFLAISGDASIVVDRPKIADMWEDAWKLWFPNGPTSADIALVQVRPVQAEYWDQSLPRGISFALEAIAAWAKDEPIEPPEGPEHHAKVDLG
jgi:general stress protein 26